MARQQKGTAKQQQAVDAWNRSNPVGTECTVRLDSGLVKLTKTRSEAYMLGGHTAVIFLDGISGAYLLERVNRFEPVEA